MYKRGSTYWACQFGGWGLLAGINMFFYLTLSIKKVEYFPLIILESVCVGFFCSHLMRMIIKKYNFLNKTIQKQISSFVFITILIALLYSIIEIAILNFFHLEEKIVPQKSLLKKIGSNFISDFFILFIWNLIYYAFHYVEKNLTQKVDTLKLQSLVKELELKTIRSHINPHFIFNALNSIRALVDENPTRARTAITELSNILRSSMQAEKLETVKFEKELDIVNDYLALEKIRFEERLSVELDIDSDTLQNQVPPMMLQTLVENAIKHGISKKIEGGWIKIISTFKGNTHHLIIQNAGQLNAIVNEHGFGIRSTQDRLNLLYQNKAKFTIINLNKDTVQSTISIPINI